MQHSAKAAVRCWSQDVDLEKKVLLILHVYVFLMDSTEGFKTEMLPIKEINIEKECSALCDCVFGYFG